MAIASAVVLVGAGTGASLVLAGAGAGGGASSPAAAVQQMIDALNKSDVIGVLDNLAPGERNALEPGLEDIFGQLKRMGVLSSAADINDITGLHISEQGLAASTDQLTPDVAAVTVSGGTNSDAVDPGQLPLGSYFQGLVDRTTNSRSVSTTGPNSGKATLGTVKVDGGWYVSLGYSIAINALRSSGHNGAPPATGQLQPVGAPSPQGAVQALFNSVSQLDLTGLLAGLDPEELGAVDAYPPYWLPSAQTALDKLQGQVGIKFGNLGFSTEAVDSGTLVKVDDGLTLSVKAHGVNVKYANGCYTVTGSGAPAHQCISGGDQDEAKLLDALPPAVQPIFKRLTTMRPDTGFVTVEENGKWFVSPTRTYLSAISAELSEFQPGDIQAIIQNASGIGNALVKYERKAMNDQGFKLPSGNVGSILHATDPASEEAASSALQAEAEADAINAFVEEMSYYAVNSAFTSNAKALDPLVPWSRVVSRGHVALLLGCDTAVGRPATMKVDACHGRTPQVVAVRSLAQDASACYTIVADESGTPASRSSNTWYNVGARCPTALPFGPAKAGSAASHEGTGWYEAF